jgi:hypothetical protein
MKRTVWRKTFGTVSNEHLCLPRRLSHAPAQRKPSTNKTMNAQTGRHPFEYS